MSLFFERRDAFPVPPINPNSQAGSVSLRRTDLTKAEGALQKGAVWGSVNLLASTLSTVPIDVYRGEGRDKTNIRTPRWLEDLGGSGYGTGDWLYQIVMSGGLRGNGLGLIVDRDPVTGQARTIDPLHPDCVRLSGDPSKPDQWFINGEQVPKANIWHWRRYPFPGQTMGLSPIALHAITLTLGLSAQNFGAQWFIDGAHPSSILTNDRVSNIDKIQAATVKERFISAVRGTREPVVLGGGWKYQQVQIAPAESQFLETQKYTEAACARIYGPGMPEILGYETGGSMTYANIEQRAIDLLMFTFNPWLVSVERFLSALLPQPQKAKFNRKALLQTDTFTRFQAHQIALANNFETINEVRDIEDMGPVEWGDKPYKPTMETAPTVIPQKGAP